MTWRTIEKGGPPYVKLWCGMLCRDVLTIRSVKEAEPTYIEMELGFPL